jgi:hypothetical protein
VTRKSQKESSWDEDDDKSEKPKIEFFPGPGTHVFWFENKIFWLSINRDNKPTNTGWDNKLFM